MGRIRLYVKQKPIVGRKIVLDAGQSHYLGSVMKVVPGDEVGCFDGQSGEYGCEVAEIGKKNCVLNVISHDRLFEPVPDIWLLFSPVKKDNTDFIIQKATELGVRRLIPVITRRTISARVNTERFALNTIEAAEQCRRTDVPEISGAVKLENVLKTWDSCRPLYFMDETQNSRPVAEVFASAPAPCAILVGPEGGFDKAELECLRQLPYARGVSLGRRILRAETAVAAALSCWQALSGDWQ